MLVYVQRWAGTSGQRDTTARSRPAAPFDAALITAGDLAFAEQRQRLADRHLPTAGLVDQAVELVPQGRELQAVQHGDQVVMPAHQKRPPITASYSAKGRSKAGVSDDDASVVAIRVWAAPSFRRYQPSGDRPRHDRVAPSARRARQFAAAVKDAHRASSDSDPHPLADQSPRHRGGIPIHLDGTIGTHTAQKVARAQEGRSASIGRKASASSRSKRRFGVSPVVPCTRASATCRIQASRWASISDQEAKHRPAIAFDLT